VQLIDVSVINVIMQGYPPRRTVTTSALVPRLLPNKRMDEPGAPPSGLTEKRAGGEMRVKGNVLLDTTPKTDSDSVPRPIAELGEM
jgi:hypothetical protein